MNDEIFLTDRDMTEDPFPVRLKELVLFYAGTPEALLFLPIILMCRLWDWASL